MYPTLVECTVQMLKLLYGLFQSQIMSYEEFDLQTKIKIEFLKESIALIHSTEERKAAQDILDKCSSVLSFYGPESPLLSSRLTSSM